MKKLELNAYTLKMIAIIAMIMQHTAMVFRDYLPLQVEVIMHIAGGITFPILAYFVTEGYKHTSNFKKYITRLFIFALIAQVPFALALGSAVFLQYNILFTMLLGLLFIQWYEMKKGTMLFYLTIPVFLVASIFVQFTFIGVLMIFLFHVIQNEKLRILIPSLLSILFFTHTFEIIPQILNGSFNGINLDFFYYIAMGLGNIIALCLLYTYNGQRGKSMKYFFYSVYPLHYAVLIAVAYLLGTNLIFYLY